MSAYDFAMLFLINFLNPIALAPLAIGIATHRLPIGIVSSLGLAAFWLGISGLHLRAADWVFIWPPVALAQFAAFAVGRVLKVLWVKWRPRRPSVTFRPSGSPP